MFDNLKLDLEVKRTLDGIYRQSLVYNPQMSPDMFLETIIKQWLDTYRIGHNTKELKRHKVRLRNNLRAALILKGKSQRQLARETGINPSYLSGLINEKYEPSITVVYLIANALGYNPSRIGELFWLEPVEKV